MYKTRFLWHFRTATRILLFSSAGAISIAVSSFLGAHAFIQYTDPAPKQWTSKAKFSYRAAVLNSKYLHQLEAAKSNVLTAIWLNEQADAQLYDANRQENTGLSEMKSSLYKAHLLLGDIESQMGNLKDAVPCYLAAEIEAGQNLDLRSIAARKAGELQAQLGRLEEAEQLLISAITSHAPDFKSKSLRSSTELAKVSQKSQDCLDSVISFSLVRARLGYHSEALQNLLAILQAQMEMTTYSAVAECKQAVIMANIAQIVCVLGDRLEAMRWSQKALIISSSKIARADQYCMRCAAMTYNTMGLLKLESNDMQRANNYFAKAVALADCADDEAGVFEYSSNFERTKSSQIPVETLP